MTDDDRRERYAAEFARVDGHDWDEIVVRYPQDATAYRELADEEIASLRAERDTMYRDLRHLADVTKAEVLREAADELARWRGHEDAVIELRRMADEIEAQS